MSHLELRFPAFLPTALLAFVLGAAVGCGGSANVLPGEAGATSPEGGQGGPGGWDGSIGDAPSSVLSFGDAPAFGGGDETTSSEAASCNSGSCAPEAGAVCGNGAVEPGETCDDGNTTPGDGCSGI